MMSRLPAIAVLLGCLAPLASAQRVPRVPPPPDPLFALLRQVGQDAAASTVWIRCDEKAVALGTVVDERGLIMTKASELKGDAVVRLGSGKEAPATLVSTNRDHDLALLQVDPKQLGVEKLAAVRFAEGDDPAPGAMILCPAPDGAVPAAGVISTPRRRIARQAPLLGLTLEDIAPRGARVAGVLPQSGAERAGVEVDDVILAVDGRRTDTRNAIVTYLSSRSAGDRVTVTLRRGQEQKELPVTLSPGNQVVPSRSAVMNRMGGGLSVRADGFPAVLQHDSVLDPELCGGPLVNIRGQTVAINIARAGRVETYAIPAQVVLQQLERMKLRADLPETPDGRDDRP